MLLWHASPRAGAVFTGATGDPPNGVKPAMGVVLGVVLKDRVGRAPEAPAVAAVVPAPVVGNAEVASARAVFVGGGVLEGAARAVWVSCAEICPMAVATAAVLIALISTVGAGVAPTLHAASISVVISNMSRVRRGNVRTSICLP